MRWGQTGQRRDRKWACCVHPPVLPERRKTAVVKRQELFWSGGSLVPNVVLCDGGGRYGIKRASTTLSRGGHVQEGSIGRLDTWLMKQNQMLLLARFDGYAMMIIMTMKMMIMMNIGQGLCLSLAPAI